MITVAIAEDEAAVTRKLTNMAQYAIRGYEVDALDSAYDDRGPSDRSLSCIKKQKHGRR